jgi:hypothetical protein
MHGQQQQGICLIYMPSTHVQHAATICKQICHTCLCCLLQTNADKHKTLILCSEYWTNVANTKKLLEPLIKLLRLADGDTPTTGKVHYYAHKVRCSSRLAVSLQSAWLNQVGACMTGYVTFSKCCCCWCCCRFTPQPRAAL